MPSLPPRENLSKIMYLDNHPIYSTNVQLLDERRTVYRFALDPGSYRHSIPQTVTSVIVKQQKNNWEKEFWNEKAVYDKLKELQGKVIPFFFGQGYYDGLPALVLSEIDGVTLYELARSKNDFPAEALKTYLEDVFRQFSEYGALYRDQRLDNFLLCDQGSQRSRVMVVDLEQVDFPDRLHPWERLINSDGAMSIMQDFEDMRYPHREPSPVRIWRVSG
ncbi:hypothetical protein N7471_008333 [Penicillium samsonianum]|uniref:uncharacterized protein n=1 Tax=Penicillium samsonianum TaxID=1882272 RepID=UPI0025492BA9|nr:uncharacterized protein N7471_008333 [Penicillium samsonianum]KAJ6133118.1 hypothetical protein N7471_008333 [Penicillium samsonianum]